MIEISLIRDLVAIFGVIAGFTYYVLTVRANQKSQEILLKNQELTLKAQQQALETRQAQLFMQIFDRFHSPEFFEKYTQVLEWKWTNYEDFLSKYGPATNPQAWYSEGSIAAFFEGVGLLIYQGLIDVKLVHGLLFRHVKLYWEKIEPISNQLRKQLKLPHIDQWFEYLYVELMKQEKQIMKT